MPATDSQIERLQRLLQSLGAISASELGTDALLDRIVAETMSFTDASGAVVERVVGDDMVYVKAAGQIADFIGLTIPRHNSLSGLCVETGDIQRCEDTETDPRVNRDACRTIGIRSMLVVPLIYGAEVIGVIKASSEHVAAFNEEHTQALKVAASVIAAVLGRQTILERTALEGQELNEQLARNKVEREQLRSAAFVDSLTGLPNRRALERALDNAIALYRDKPHRMALLFIDINHFKSINDKLGHRVGDLALQRVARLLRSRMHFAARLSGDEFVLLLTELEQGAKQVEAVCEQLLHEAAEPCSLAEGIVLPLSLSIGVAVPSAATLTRSEWLRWADEAMYLAKKNGGGFAVHENIGSGLGRT